MKRTAIVSLILLAIPAAAFAMDDSAVMQPKMLKWSAAPPSLPVGAQMSVLSGDPGSTGPFVVRAKLPAGYKIPAHTHPADESVTVISGAFHIGMGDKLDMKKGEMLRDGAFVNVVKGMQHYAWTTAPTILQIHGTGPLEITYVNPADDPRNASAEQRN